MSYTPMVYVADDSRLCLSTDYISELTVADAEKVCAKILDKEYEISYVPYEDGELVQMSLAGKGVKTKFDIDAEEGELSSGQFAVVVIYRFYREDVLTIPINALYEDSDGQYVYKQVDDERERCEVTVGMTTMTEVEIVEGIEEGDMVYVKE